MASVPDEAVEAAARAMSARLDAYMDTGFGWEHFAESARAALEAAAPVLADHVAQAILAHRDAHGPQDGSSRRRWRRILGIAARVASLAFSTEEDIKRQAAQAIAEGNFAGCYERED